MRRLCQYLNVQSKFYLSSTASDESAVEYAATRRRQRPMLFNEAREVELPFPNLEENEEVPSVELPIPQSEENAAVPTDDPLGDVKPELVVFTINEQDHAEMQGMLVDGGENVECASIANLIENIVTTIDPENLVTNDANATDTATQSSYEAERMKNDRLAARTERENLSTNIVDNDVHVELTEKENAATNEANANVVTTSQVSHEAESVDNVQANPPTNKSSSDGATALNILPKGDQTTMSTNAIQEIRNTAGSSDSNVSDADEDLIFLSDVMPTPMGNFRHALVKHEDDDLSPDLCYKIVVSKHRKRFGFVFMKLTYN